MLGILKVMWSDSISLDKHGRGLLQIKQTVEEEKRARNDYIKNSTEHALKTVSNEELLKVNESKSEYHKKELKNRQERWQSKLIHGQYL